MASAFENKIRIIPYLLLWLIYAVVHTLAMRMIIAVPWWTLITDGILHAVLFATIGAALGSIFRYGNQESLSKQQQLINYVVLGLLTLLIWIGLGFLLDYIIVGHTYIKAFVPTLPVRTMMALMLYIIFALSFRSPKKDEVETEESVFAEEVQTLPLLPQEALTPPEIELLERVTVKDGQKIHIIPVGEIFYLQSDGDYVRIVTPQGKFLKEQTMKYFESHLPTTLFVRIHRTHIINIEHISRIEQYGKQNQLISLKNGEHLKASLAGYRNLRAALNL